MAMFFLLPADLSLASPWWRRPLTLASSSRFPQELSVNSHRSVFSFWGGCCSSLLSSPLRTAQAPFSCKYSCSVEDSLQSARRWFFRISAAGKGRAGSGSHRAEGEGGLLKMAASVLNGNSSINGGASKPVAVRKVIDHVVLFRMKEGFTEDQEKEMLDHLYTLQYHCRGVLAISLGRVTSANSEGVTHGFFTRFPSKESLVEYMNHPARLKVANELIRPFYYGLFEGDFEANVEDDIEPLFRRGEKFEQGVELITLLKMKEDTSEEAVDSLLRALLELPDKLGDSIVQITAGTNFSSRNGGYTHCYVARLPSEEALEAFLQHSSYLEIVSTRVELIASAVLSVSYLVQPVGTTIGA